MGSTFTIEPPDTQAFTIEPPDKQETAQPSFLDRIGSAAGKVIETMPQIEALHKGAEFVQHWAQRQEPSSNPERTPGSPLGDAAKQFGAGVLADTAGLVSGATTPKAIATTGAAIVAPEVVGPAMVAHGIYKGVTGWGDLSDPDVLQNELNAGAEVAGGAALGAGTLKAGGGPVTQAVKGKISANAAAKAPAEAFDNFQKAIPPMKSASYQQADYEAVRPYLEQEHNVNAIETVKGVREAADSVIGKAEDLVAEHIAQKPYLQIQTNPISDVQRALSTNQRGQSFVDAGIKDLQDFHLDQPKTVGQADAIRRQLNQENKAVLKKNSYDQETARSVDPGFAAREAAAESLRNGIYDEFPGLREVRLDEGSAIKIRNAAQNQEFNGQKKVGGTGAPGPIRRGLRRASTVAGAALGSAGGPVGSAVGAEAGGALAESLSPQNLTRDSLVAKSFEKPVAAGTQTQMARVAAALRNKPPVRISGLLPPATYQVTSPTLVTPPPQGPKLLPERSGAPLVTPLPNESMIDYLKRRSIQR